MAISITLKDANKDGKGIDFNAYLKAYDKKFEPSDYGGFINEDYDNGGTPGDMSDDVWRGDDYVVWDGKKNGQSVILEGDEDGWKYVFDGHTMTGDITAVTFGTKTKTSDSNPEYTNNGEIRVAFDTFTTKFGTGDFVNSLTDGNTRQFLKFLNSDSIEFTGSSGKDSFVSFNKADVLHGGGGADKLDGAGGNDTIHGDKGSDTLTGGRGGDTFVFASGDGKDRITDFGRGADRIDFDGQFSDFDAIVAAAKDTGKGVRIAYDGGSVLLEGVKLADLSEGDFLFDI
jgi:Ca2+-binding RTX toxin-like protein